MSALSLLKGSAASSWGLKTERNRAEEIFIFGVGGGAGGVVFESCNKNAIRFGKLFLLWS